MAQETKVGLLIGLALILLVGLVLSDLFTGDATDPGEENQPTEFGREAQAGIYPEPAAPEATTGEARRGLDRSLGFQAEPAQDYRSPSSISSPPAERWSPPSTPVSPAEDHGPQQTLEPPLPELDTLEARNAMAHFNDSLEAMRLKVQNPDQETTRLNRPVMAGDTAIRPTAPTDASQDAYRASTEERALLASGGTTYIHYVQPGQTLTQIARQHYGNPEFASAIALTNPHRIDPEGQVRPGSRLEIPPLGSPVFSRMFAPVHADHAPGTPGAIGSVSRTAIPGPPHRPAGPTAEVAANPSTTEILVQPGDTLSELAADHLGSATKWKQLLEANADRLDSAEALRSGMKLRLPAITPTRTASSPVERGASVATSRTPAKTYTVEAGDNLTRIARELLGDGDRWDELLAANADQLDRPENLRVGMKLKLPTTASASSIPPRTSEPQALVPTRNTSKTYTVQAGDNLTRIARAQLGDGDRWRELFETNADRLDSPDDLYAGQTLRLP